MLQVIISPAKQMRVARDAFAPRGIPPFPDKTHELHQALLDIERAKGPTALQALWKVSDKLLAENIERLHAFEPIADGAALDDPLIARLISPAVSSYVGIQYQSMAPEVLDLDALDWLQRHLWITSGLYGCVRPFDAVEPYRLEMGAALAMGGARNLYEFWGDKIAWIVTHDVGAAERGESRTGKTAAAPGAYRAAAASTGNEMPGASEVAVAPEASVVVNLASVEYAKAVLPYLSTETAVVTCLFGEELRRGKPVQRATASKIARGSMVRWMAMQSIEDAADLKRFDVGYHLAEELCFERNIRQARNATGGVSGGDGSSHTGAREHVLVFMKA